MSDTRSYDAVLREIENLKREAELIRQNEIKAAVDQAREIIAKYQLTTEDLGFAPVAGRKAKGKSAAKGVKYRSDTNPSDTYGGRGPLPGWLKQKLNEGRRKEEFLVR